MQTEISPASARTSIGRALHAQRLVQCMSIEEVALQLRLSPEIVEAMELDDHERLGAAVFARGRVGSYARLLGIPMNLVDAQFERILSEPPPLVGHVHAPNSAQGLRWFAGKGIYMAIAAAVAIPMIAMAAMHRAKPAPVSLAVLDGTTSPIRDGSSPASRGTIFEVGSDANKQAGVPGSAPDGQHIGVASRTAAGSGVDPSAASGDLQLRFSGDNWIDIVDAGGHVIDRGKVEAGSVRHYRTAAVARVTIGDPASVQVLHNGEPVDLTRFRSANQTRFALSSSGQPTPVRD
jgi:cytoskeleton protein RodZ